MLSCIIHFGMHKTGSSSIQSSLCRHLNDDRFHYVDLGNANASGSLQTAFMKDPLQTPAYKRGGAGLDEIARQKGRIIANLISEIRSAEEKTAILSGEGLLNLSEQELQDLINILGIERNSIKVVGYVRSPKGYMESAFQQVVKAGVGRFIIPNLYPAYRKRFEKLDTAFGRQNVFFWPFEPGSFAGGCVVQDFCLRLGVAFNPEDAIRVNEGLPLPAIALLYAYMKFGSGGRARRDVIGGISRLVRKVAKLSGPKLRFHSDIVAPIIYANRDDIAWMEARLGHSLTEDLTTDDDQAVRSEADLLAVGPEALQWLAEQLGTEYADRWKPGMSPKDVAEWMHTLRLRMIIERKGSPETGGKRSLSTRGDGELTIKELVRRAKQAPRHSFGAIQDANAVALVGEIFKQIGEDVGSLGEGIVNVDGLGRFRVRKVQRARETPKVSEKRISFVAARTRNTNISGEQ